jgi:hypothetical protein
VPDITIGFCTGGNHDLKLHSLIFFMGMSHQSQNSPCLLIYNSRVSKIFRWRAREKLYAGEVEDIRPSSRLCSRARWWALKTSQSVDDRMIEVVCMAKEILSLGGYRRRNKFRVSPVNMSIWRSITSFTRPVPISESIPWLSSHAAPSRHIKAEPMVSSARAAITRSSSRPWGMCAIRGALNDLEFSHWFIADKYARAILQKHRSSPDFLSSRSGTDAHAKASKALKLSLNLLWPLAYRDTLLAVKLVIVCTQSIQRTQSTPVNAEYT